MKYYQHNQVSTKAHGENKLLKDGDDALKYKHKLFQNFIKMCSMLLIKQKNEDINNDDNNTNSQSK